jgi:hypothetical protein
MPSSLMQSLILCFCRRVVPVILEDGSENLSALDSALQDRTAQDWVSAALTSCPTFHFSLPSEPYVIFCASIVTVRPYEICMTNS